MLMPIPARMLSQTAVFIVPATFDQWGNVATSQSYTVSRVHLQPTNEVRKTKDNTEVILRSILFVDGRLSMPALNLLALQRSAEAAGGVLTVTIDGDSYAALTVELIPDDMGRLHHWEVGLV